MSFIKKYWFGTTIGLFLAMFIVVLVLILISPKQDAKNRGFVYCTQNLIDDLIECDKQLWCTSKSILKNSWCDIHIIGQGLRNWVKGQQDYPWSNYIFEPELSQDSYVDEEARQEYLKEFPNTSLEMKNLLKLRKELENEENMQVDLKELWQEE